MQTIYCTRCGAAADQDDQSCEGCGNRLYGPEQFIPYAIPLKRVAFMTAASGGLYFFYWFYLTWKQYRDHTREEAYPFWHVMTQSVPIYSLFRVHAHMRVYARLMRDRDMASTINPMLAVGIILAANVLSLVAWLMTLQGGLSQGQAIIALALAVIQTAITIWLLVGVQQDLNRYWVLASTSVGRAGIGAGEIILAVLGSISWLLMIGAAASDSFRAL